MVERCFACNGFVVDTHLESLFLKENSCGICGCINPTLMNPPSITTTVDNSVGNVDNVLPMFEDDTDPELRIHIAIEAMTAIESANFENAHQAAISVEEVADRAVRMADALIARLKQV